MEKRIGYNAGYVQSLPAGLEEGVMKVLKFHIDQEGALRREAEKRGKGRSQRVRRKDSKREQADNAQDKVRRAG